MRCRATRAKNNKQKNGAFFLQSHLIGYRLAGPAPPLRRPFYYFFSLAQRPDDGHVDLSFAVASLTATKKKMCEGLMIVTNIMDILQNITLPASSSYGSITSLPGTVADFKTAIITADPGLSVLVNTTSQAACETLVTSASEFNNLQYIYALLFEAGLP